MVFCPFLKLRRCYLSFSYTLLLIPIACKSIPSTKISRFPPFFYGTTARKLSAEFDEVILKLTWRNGDIRFLFYKDTKVKSTVYNEYGQDCHSSAMSRPQRIHTDES